MNKSYTTHEWEDLIETVAQSLYEADDITEEERYAVLRVLEEKTTSFINVSHESKKILDRRSHLDATHIGQHLNACFYMSLENIDFCFDSKDRQWIPCQWEGQRLDEIAIPIQVKSKQND